MSRAPYIIIEGPDGAGKSSLIRELCTLIHRKYMTEPLSEVEPHERKVTDMADQWLVEGDARALAYEADRVDMEPVLARQLAAGRVTIQDRSFYSTLAYQDPSPAVREFILRPRRIEPDLILLLDAPAEALDERLKQRGEVRGVYEEDVEFLEKVRWSYRRLLISEEKAVLIDANREQATVLNEAWARVEKLLDRWVSSR